MSDHVASNEANPNYAANSAAAHLPTHQQDSYPIQQMKVHEAQNHMAPSEQSTGQNCADLSTLNQTPSELSNSTVHQTSHERPNS